MSTIELERRFGELEREVAELKSELRERPVVSNHYYQLTVDAEDIMFDLDDDGEDRGH